ncbi:MAG: hypothetical protein WCT01_00710 [Candidatus Shapirobacteria bacterium]
MFKEITLAIILGGLLGVGLTGGIITLKNQNRLPHFNQVAADTFPTPVLTVSLTASNLTSPTTQVSPTSIVPTPPPTSNIEITNFKSGQIVSKSVATLKGLSPPNSQIIIVTPQGSVISSSTPDGLFEIDVQLESGFNPLEITCIDPQDVTTQINFSLTYSTAQI